MSRVARSYVWAISFIWAHHISDAEPSMYGYTGSIHAIVFRDVNWLVKFRLIMNRFALFQMARGSKKYEIPYRFVAIQEDLRQNTNKSI